MRRLERLHLEFPFPGSRMLRRLLAVQGSKSGRRAVKTLMRRMETEALYRCGVHVMTQQAEGDLSGSIRALLFDTFGIVVD